ncbi:MAG: TerB family tellurite resistance protein [Treponema sp.]|nr:TerB family tellurite resistance protein [Treponema sp.]
MKEFDQLCKEFEQLDIVSYNAYLAEKSAAVIPVLSDIAEDGVVGTSIFFSFIMGAIAADGRFSEEEYALIYPLLQVFFGDSIDYEECKKVFKAFRKENKQLKKLVDQMVDILGLLSEELKDDIVIICMMICAIDGKISQKEKKWIKQLIA